MGDDCVPLTNGTIEDDRSARDCPYFAGQEAWHWDLNQTLLPGLGRRAGLSTASEGCCPGRPCSPGPEAPTAGVVGPAVHALLDVGLRRASLG